MKFNAQKFALAAAVTAGVLYVICAVFVFLFPDLALKLLGWMVHLMNIDQFVGVQVTVGGFITGLLPILFYSFVGAYLFVWLYNKFTR